MAQNLWWPSLPTVDFTLKLKSEERLEARSQSIDQLQLTKTTAILNSLPSWKRFAKKKPLRTFLQVSGRIYITNIRPLFWRWDQEISYKYKISKCQRHMSESSSHISPFIHRTALCEKSIIFTACRLWKALPDNTKFTDKRARFGDEARDLVRQGLWVYFDFGGKRENIV